MRKRSNDAVLIAAFTVVLSSMVVNDSRDTGKVSSSIVGLLTETKVSIASWPLGEVKSTMAGGLEIGLFLIGVTMTGGLEIGTFLIGVVLAAGLWDAFGVRDFNLSTAKQTNPYGHDCQSGVSCSIRLNTSAYCVLRAFSAYSLAVFLFLVVESLTPSGKLVFNQVCIASKIVLNSSSFNVNAVVRNPLVHCLGGT